MQADSVHGRHFMLNLVYDIGDGNVFNSEVSYQDLKENQAQWRAVTIQVCPSYGQAKPLSGLNTKSESMINLADLFYLEF